MKGGVVFLVLACLATFVGVMSTFTQPREYVEANGPSVTGMILRLAVLFALAAMGVAFLRACGCANGDGPGGDADDR